MSKDDMMRMAYDLGESALNGKIAIELYNFSQSGNEADLGPESAKYLAMAVKDYEKWLAR